MNEKFNYIGNELWNPDEWAGRSGKINSLIEAVYNSLPFIKTEYNPPAGAYAPTPSDENGFVGYLDPKEEQFWENHGVRVYLRHIWTSQWLAFIPKNAAEDRNEVYPTVVSFHKEKITGGCDPCWAMKTLICCRDFAMRVLEKNNILIMIVVDDVASAFNYSSLLMEACSMFPIDFNSIRMDISSIDNSKIDLNKLLHGIPASGSERMMPIHDANIEVMEGIKLLDISSTWLGTGSANYTMYHGTDGQGGGNKAYDFKRFRHTLAACRLIEPLRLEHDYLKSNDSKLLDFWCLHGVKYEEHVISGRRWVSVAPAMIEDNSCKKIPLMLIFQEVYIFGDHLPIEAVANWYEYVRLVMQGECMIAFYAGECQEENEYMTEVYEEACSLYPVDKSRVYVTGFSHNSGNATQFAFQHADIITALAGGTPGLVPVGDPVERNTILEDRRKVDMPSIFTFGMCEHFMPLKDPDYKTEYLIKTINRDILIAYDCDMRTEEDFKKAYSSQDTATRKIGFPGDKNEVLFLEGIEHYIVDVKNKEGKYHLRFVAIENAPHCVFPTKEILEWSFVRRFSRDPETLQIKELY